MQYIFNQILTIRPIVYDYHQYRAEHLQMHYQNNADKPFFECFIRKNISPQMQKKIWRKYPNAAEIISFCKKTNQTLRFTRDINKAKDFTVEFKRIKLTIN